MSSEVVRHVVSSITPASAAQADAARQRVARAGVPMFERLAGSIAAAQHSSRLRGERRTLVITSGDHGAGEPGVSLGASHPTILAARAIADGSAAVAHAARTARMPIILVDAGVREPAEMPDIAVQLGRGPSRDLLVEPALTIVDASLGLEAGIALGVSLADAGLDVLALGAIGVGSELAAAALLGATFVGAIDPSHEDDLVRAHQLGVEARAHALAPLELLARFGSTDTAVLAGLILVAASMNVPVILDSYATGAAALAACAFAPATAGYLVAAHAGSVVHPSIVRHLGLEPVFEVGLGHGDGTGAAMILPLIDQVVGLTTQG